MKHPIEVEGFNGSIDDLVKNIGKLRYDIAQEFLYKLSEEYSSQAYNDREGGRINLGRALFQLHCYLNSAQKEMWRIWRICRPYMKEELKEK